MFLSVQTLNRLQALCRCILSSYKIEKTAFLTGSLIMTNTYIFFNRSEASVPRGWETLGRGSAHTHRGSQLMIGTREAQAREHEQAIPHSTRLNSAILESILTLFFRFCFINENNDRLNILFQSIYSLCQSQGCVSSQTTESWKTIFKYYLTKQNNHMPMPNESTNTHNPFQAEVMACQKDIFWFK